MDKKLITCSIFLDLRKAYDTINHIILIKKLEKYGIRGLPLQLLAIYLTDRQQYTIVNRYKSKSRDVICGIPQGSTLGLLLFNIYINDLPLASSSTIHLFADDTNLTLSHSNVSTVQQNINDEFVNVSNWFKVNKLSEVESRTQGSRPRTQKKSKAKDSLSEDRRSRGQEQECSRPRTQAQVLSKKKKGLHKYFSSDLHEDTFFKRSTKF